MLALKTVLVVGVITKSFREYCYSSDRTEFRRTHAFSVSGRKWSTCRLAIDDYCSHTFIAYLKCFISVERVWRDGGCTQIRHHLELDSFSPACSARCLISDKSFHYFLIQPIIALFGRIKHPCVPHIEHYFRIEYFNKILIPIVSSSLSDKSFIFFPLGFINVYANY